MIYLLPTFVEAIYNHVTIMLKVIKVYSRNNNPVVSQNWFRKQFLCIPSNMVLKTIPNF